MTFLRGSQLVMITSGSKLFVPGIDAAGIETDVRLLSSRCVSGSLVGVQI